MRQLSYQEASTPVEVRVVGTDIDSMQSVAVKIEEILAETGGANWIHSNTSFLLTIFSTSNPKTKMSSFRKDPARGGFSFLFDSFHFFLP